MTTTPTTAYFVSATSTSTTTTASISTTTTLPPVTTNTTTSTTTTTGTCSSSRSLMMPLTPGLNKVKVVSLSWQTSQKVCHRQLGHGHTGHGARLKVTVCWYAGLKSRWPALPGRPARICVTNPMQKLGWWSTLHMLHMLHMLQVQYQLCIFYYSLISF